MKHQKAIHDKVVLGYNSIPKKKFLKNMFVNVSSKYSSFTCFKYNKEGHKAFECNSKRIVYIIVKQICIPKGTKSINLKGSNKTYVPKLKF